MKFRIAYSRFLFILRHWFPVVLGSVCIILFYTNDFFLKEILAFGQTHSPYLFLSVLIPFILHGKFDYALMTLVQAGLFLFGSFLFDVESLLFPGSLLLWILFFTFINSATLPYARFLSIRKLPELPLIQDLGFLLVFSYFLFESKLNLTFHVYIGICIALLISFGLQFVYFRFLLAPSLSEGKPWYSLSVLIRGAVGFFLFIISSQIFTLLLLLPDNKHVGSFRMRTLTSYASFFTRIMLNLKVCITGKQTLDQQCIIVSNHQTFMDIPLMISLTHRLVMVTNDWVKTSKFTRILQKFSRFYAIPDEINQSTEDFRRMVEEKHSIMIFPEGKRSDSQEIRRFHKGAFFIATQYNLDIQPIVILTIGDFFERGPLFLKKGKIYLELLDKVSPEKDYGKDAKRVKRIIADKKREIHLSTDNLQYIADEALRRVLVFQPYFHNRDLKLYKKLLKILSVSLETNDEIVLLGDRLLFLLIGLRMLHSKTKVSIRTDLQSELPNALESKGKCICVAGASCIDSGVIQWFESCNEIFILDDSPKKLNLHTKAAELQNAGDFLIPEIFQVEGIVKLERKTI